MWNRITEDNWIKIIEGLDLPIFFKHDYLKSISNSFSLQLNYFSFFKNSQVVSLFAFFSDSNRDIIIPEGFSYSPFYFQADLSEKLYVDTVTSLIKILKKDFKNIKLKLPTDITDVRPFIWENFSAEIKYTHIKKNGLLPEISVLKSLGKDFNNDYQFKVEELNKSSLMLNLEFLKTLDISQKKISHHEELLKNWFNCGYLKAFNLYRNNFLICSNLVLIDYYNSKAFTILLNKVDKQFKYAHANLYSNIILWCKENSINTIDFCGANFQTISEFKSRFNTDLKMYFVVNYYPINNLLLKFKKRVIKTIFKMKI